MACEHDGHEIDPQSARFHGDFGSLINIGAALTHRAGPELADGRMQNGKPQWDDV